MTTLQRAALFSVGLHMLTVVVLLAPWPSSRPKSTPVPPAMVVDFLKVGPRSTAPLLGPGGNGRAAKLAKKNEKPTLLRPKTQTKPAQPLAKAQSFKPVSKTKKPAIKAKTKAPSSKVAPGKAGNKKTNLHAKTQPQKRVPSAHRAKVNLHPPSRAVSSMDDLMGAVAKGGTGGARAEQSGEELTGTEVDLLNRHMKQFWNVPSGHKTASELVVEVELFIRPDGSVEDARIVDAKRMQSDPEFRVAAESALRAVTDPACSPLPLDPKKHALWKHMIFVFDPQEMCR